MDFSWLPSGAELATAIPVIISLIIIEGLLSVDNAMAIAAMASELPKRQQKLALRLGILGAYGFRGLCLFLVSWIVENQWLKFVGAGYLLYLMAEHLTKEEEQEETGNGKRLIGKSLLLTVVQIEVMDLSLSLDNVVAAVALDKRLWVVCTGVFIGILALRFVAGYCIQLIDRFPILKKTAFMLVGFVGLILLVELTAEYMHAHVHISSLEKFAGILAITGASLWYGNTLSGKKFLGPLVKVGFPVVRALDGTLGLMMLPFIGCYRGARFVVELGHKTLCGRKPPTGQSANSSAV